MDFISVTETTRTAAEAALAWVFGAAGATVAVLGALPWRGIGFQPMISGATAVSREDLRLEAAATCRRMLASRIVIIAPIFGAGVAMALSSISVKTECASAAPRATLNSGCSIQAALATDSAGSHCEQL